MSFDSEEYDLNEGAGHGASRGHPSKTGSFFDELNETNRVGFGNRVGSLSRDNSSSGVFHDEGGQVVVLNGEFFGRYRVSVGTQEMFDAGQEIVAYSGVAGEGYKCIPYAQQRRLSFVTPMGLPLGEILIFAEALESNQSPIRGSFTVVKRPHLTRLYSLASMFPSSFLTNVATTIREEILYDEL